MQKNDDNPLTPAILQVIRAAEKRLAIHELLQELKAATKIPSLDDDVQMALFKLNWLMMNALYQLQLELIKDGYLLTISTLEIYLSPLIDSRKECLEQNISEQPLRDYYLNWSHFSDTTKEEVQALLDGVWQDYISGEDQQKAYDLLGLDADASFSLIRKTYRKLAGRYHPDKGGNSQKFMEVREAYEILRKARA